MLHIKKSAYLQLLSANIMVYLLLCIGITPQLYNFGLVLILEKAVLRRHDMQCKNLFFFCSFLHFLVKMSNTKML